jgi:diguanylate cyclase (GGDEF)-like protein
MHMPETDQLTGLLTRRSWTQTLDEALADGKACGAVLLDLDRFTLVNHVAGHCKGDEALLAVASALKRSGLVLGRISADMFSALVLEGDTEMLAGKAWAAATDALSSYETQEIRDWNHRTEQLHRVIAKQSGWPEPLHTNVDRVLGVSAVALALGSGHRASAVDLLRHLDDALDEVKRSSRGRLVMLPPLSAADQWRADNQEALDSSNQFAEGGIPLERHRNF